MNSTPVSFSILNARRRLFVLCFDVCLRLFDLACACFISLAALALNLTMISDHLFSHSATSAGGLPSASRSREPLLGKKGRGSQ